MLRRMFRGGSAANEHLTAIVGGLLLVLLAVEGATIPRVRDLLTMHAFVGMLLIPVVALKLGSTGWRMARYYLQAEEYVRRGPPNALLRVVVAPVIVLSTVVLFGTGVALLAVDQVTGPLVGLHKASFVVWFFATSVHVLAHLPTLARVLRERVPGAAARVAVAAVVVGAGCAIAVATLPGANHLQDRATSYVGIDGR